MRRSERAGSFQLFRIFETRRFLRDLASLGEVAQERIAAKLRNYVYPTLCHNPYSGPNIKRLKNWDPPTWRYRVGDWRFFYEIDEQRIVFMITADHRREAYH
jgi:mRNA interferase RelE/StbE